MHRQALVAALLLSGVAAPLAAQETRPPIQLPAPATPRPVPATPAAWPDTPVGRQAAGYVAALNDPDPDVLDRFMVEHYPTAPAMVLAQTSMMRERLGTLQLVAVERQTPTTLAALVKSSKTTQEIRLLLAVESEPPNNIARIGLAMGAAGRNLAPAAAPPP